MVFDKLVSVEFLSNLKKSTITKNSEEAKKLETVKKGKSTDGKKKRMKKKPKKVLVRRANKTAVTHTHTYIHIYGIKSLPCAHLIEVMYLKLLLA